MQELSQHTRHLEPRPWAVRQATVWAVVAVATVVAFGGYLRWANSSPLPIDSWWHQHIEVTRGSLAYALAVFMAEVGSGVGAATCAVIAAALFLALRLGRRAGTVLTAMLVGVTSSQLLKYLVLRTRPGDQLYSANGSSYPSGHTMGAAALAISIALVVSYAGWLSRRQLVWVWVAAIAWVVIMAWSRTALHVHWFSDTVAGSLLGLAAALAAFAVWQPRPTPPLVRVQPNVGGSI